VTRTRIVRTTLAIVVLTGVLAMIDGLLARTENQEVHREAADTFQRGSVLLKQGRAPEAIAPLRRAWVLERNNPGYALELGNALASAGKVDEAEPLIAEALNREPNNGEANLSEARLLLRKNSLQQASWYFHRAIYGEWKADAAGSRTAARMELVQLLAEQRRYQEMLAELISLEAETSDQPRIRQRIAHFYMVAGSPARAANIYRELEQKGPPDAELLVALGDAELASGHYRAARNAFLRAALRHTASPIQSKLQLVDTLTALDPTPRQLTSLEKYRRSIRILELAQSDLEELEKTNPNRATPETEAALNEAAVALAKKEPPHVTNEMAESIIAVVEDVWRARIHAFGDNVSQEYEPLPLLIERLSPEEHKTGGGVP
jgi:Flp pilus assembly protein TadD